MDRKLQQYVLFCAGMGSSTAWWLIMSTNLAEKASYGQNTTLVLHVCYFVVLLVGSLAYRRIEPHLRRAGAVSYTHLIEAACAPASRSTNATGRRPQVGLSLIHICGRRHVALLQLLGLGGIRRGTLVHAGQRRLVHMAGRARGLRLLCVRCLLYTSCCGGSRPANGTRRQGTAPALQGVHPGHSPVRAHGCGHARTPGGLDLPAQGRPSRRR